MIKDNFKDRTVLIIGGGGYIGIPLTENLLSQGYMVKCYDNFIYQHKQCILPLLKNPNYKSIDGDIRDKSALKRALNGVSDVILLAGLVGDPITKKYPLLSKSINENGIINCIDLLSEALINKLIFVSTCSNYGSISENSLADENFPLKPLSLYSEAKVNAEKYIFNKCKFSPCTPTVLRFATAFGISKRMRFDLTINEFCRDLALGKELTVFDAETWRQYCHVQDFSNLLSIVLNAPKNIINYEVFNAGSEENNFSKRAIVNEIKKFIPNINVKYLDKGSDPRNYKVDFKKVRNLLGFKAKYSVKMGIEEIINAVKQNLFHNNIKKLNQYGNFDLSGVK